MAKAQIIDFLLSGYRTNATDLPLVGGTVEVYAAGTSNIAYVWDDRDKTLPTTTGRSTITLDIYGRAEAYGAGIYKFVIKDFAGAAVETIDYAEFLSTQDSVEAAVDPDVLMADFVRNVDDYDAARALTGLAAGNIIAVAHRSTVGDGGGGDFSWSTSDLSAQVTADPLSGFYLAPTSDPTGVSGAWVRQEKDPVDARWFGMSTTATAADNTIAWDAIGALASPKVVVTELYPVATTEPWSNLELSGVGQNSGFSYDQSVTFDCFHFDSGSALVANNLTDLYVHDIQFRGTSDADLFAEFNNLIRLHGVTNVTFERCMVKGSRGTSIEFGSGDVLGDERHNINCKCLDNVIDGINKENGNAIMVLDMDGGTFSRNRVVNHTVVNAMPGGISIEPNGTSTFAILQNITIEGNRFNDCNAASGSININVYNSFTSKPRGFKILNNHIQDTTDAGIFLNGFASAVATDSDMDILVQGNTVSNVASGLRLFGVKGAKILNNVFDTTIQPIFVGYSDAVSKNIDVEFRGNTFKKIDNISNSGISIYTNDNIVFDNNTFIDSYTGLFFHAGTTTDFHVTNNRFLLPEAISVQAIVSDGHTFTPATNRYSGNDVAGLVNQFLSYHVDTPPVVAEVFDTTVLPSAFPHGVSIALITTDTGVPSSVKSGVLKTEKYHTGVTYFEFVTQYFIPSNQDATMLADMYWRKGSITGNTWSAWIKVTGA
jgi:hypothetical protein